MLAVHRYLLFYLADRTLWFEERTICFCVPDNFRVKPGVRRKRGVG